jgi:hypothetical protein
MKKYAGIIFTLILSTMLLTGCSFKREDALTINKDKKVNYSFVITMDDELIDMAIRTEKEDVEDISEDMRWKYVDNELTTLYQNWNKEKIDNDGIKGYKFTSPGEVDIDELVSDNFEGRYELGSAPTFKEGKLFTKKDDVYTSFFKIDIDEELESNFNNQDQISIKLVVELPNKSISNNATDVSKDGKTLTWNITKSTDIDFSFKFEKNNYMVIAIIGGICLLALSLVFILIKNKNK